ncbi:sigma-70 family RNA polymerase sigma factor [Brevibacillus sp. H7]|uniref:sigma-70 family RNA polymerase sigma factor n=1 Tax=Brevibacillus sp. H7 TaxID=3349138 RepID=UPI003812988C
MNDLVTRAQQGDDDAFGQLIQQYKTILYRTAYSYTRNEQEAIDIVQEAVYKAYVSLDSLKKSTHFQSWMIRIVINCAIDHLRKRKKHQSIICFLTIEKDRSLKQLVYQNTDNFHDLIDHLEEKYKTIIILKYLHDLTMRQIAEMLEIPIGTVKTQLHKALQLLRLEMKEGCVNE